MWRQPRPVALYAWMVDARRPPQAVPVDARGSATRALALIAMAVAVDKDCTLAAVGPLMPCGCGKHTFIGAFAGVRRCTDIADGILWVSRTGDDFLEEGG